MAACAACGGADFAPFFHSQQHACSGHYLESALDHPRKPAIPILLEWCRHCGMIRQVPGREVALDYVDIARDTARQLPDYTDAIIASLTEFNVDRGDSVVEVGANDGTFLRVLRDAGYSNLTGVEPSRSLATRAQQSGLRIRNTYFNRAFAVEMARSQGPARAVLCRHTLEHVPEPGGLAEGLAELLQPGGLAFIEVPDSDWIVSELFAHEIWDEHISYFRAGSLATLLRRTGLMPVRLQRVRFRDTRNLLCWAIRAPCPPTVACDVAADATTPAEVASFQSRWEAFAARLRAAVLDSAPPLIAIGAAHIQMNFLNFSGLADKVGLLIDDDPVKAGRYAPLAAAVPIRTTADVISSVRAGTIIRTAFPYPTWEDRVCTALGRFGIGCIMPYALR